MSFVPLMAIVIAISASSDQFQGPPALDEPILRDGQLVFPEGARIPKSMTQTELDFLDGQLIQVPRGVTPPPPGP